MFNSKSVQDVKQDFLQTIPISHKITLEECARNAFQRIIPDILRIFAPLM
jgi:hypothetical protein